MGTRRFAAEKLSAAAARRLALGAQGFGERRPTGTIDRRHLRRILDRVGLIQIDSVNVMVRSQEMPLFARLGPHPLDLIPKATVAGDLFEFWGHEASHIPTADHALYRWKMARGEELAWRHVADLNKRSPGLLDEIEQRVRIDGPVVAGDVSRRVGPKGTWWDWDDGKVALEHLFWCGRLTARRRMSDFARVYDLPERVIPAAHLNVPTPTEADARKALLLQANRAMGVATARDMAVYHRQKPKETKALINELVEAESMIPVTVEGWGEPAYLDPVAKIPRSITAASFLSPFDSVCWERDRLERVFGFRYRIELYTPQPKREYGYYVLPFLMGDRFVGRADLKADRHAGVLLVQGVYGEADIAPSGRGAIAEAMASELTAMAGWLQLDRVGVVGRGDLAGTLQAALDG